MTSPTFLEAQRRAFEAWFNGQFRDQSHKLGRDGNGYYIIALEHRFQGWLACASQPVTEEMVEAGAVAILDDEGCDALYIMASKNRDDGQWPQAYAKARIAITAALEVRNE